MADEKTEQRPEETAPSEKPETPATAPEKPTKPTKPGDIYHKHGRALRAYHVRCDQCKQPLGTPDAPVLIGFPVDRPHNEESHASGMIHSECEEAWNAATQRILDAAAIELAPGPLGMERMEAFQRAVDAAVAKSLEKYGLKP